MTRRDHVLLGLQGLKQRIQDLGSWLWTVVTPVVGFRQLWSWWLAVVFMRGCWSYCRQCLLVLLHPTVHWWAPLLKSCWVLQGNPRIKYKFGPHQAFKLFFFFQSFISEKLRKLSFSKYEMTSPAPCSQITSRSRHKAGGYSVWLRAWPLASNGLNFRTIKKWATHWSSIHLTTEKYIT